MSFGSLVWSIWNRTPSANGTGINVGNSRKNEAQNPGRKWHEPFCLWLFVVVQGYWWLLVVVGSCLWSWLWSCLWSLFSGCLFTSYQVLPSLSYWLTGINTFEAFAFQRHGKHHTMGSALYKSHPASWRQTSACQKGTSGKCLTRIEAVEKPKMNL
jgi:hypothetical protein